MKITLNGEIVERVSKKTGNSYTALEIDLGMGVKKLVFLDTAEIALLTINSK